VSTGATAGAPGAVRGRLCAGLLRRASHRLALRLYVRRAMSREDRFRMLGFALSVQPTVFHPRLFGTSRFFGRYLRTRDLHHAEILEIGCGSGILSFVAARRGARVTALDINPRAVRCTEANARSNGLEARVNVLESDLFDSLSAGRAFDHIVWNPPFYGAEQTDDASRAWNAGPAYGVINRFARSACRFLRPGGSVILVTSSDAGEREILSAMAREGFAALLRARRRGLFETLSIFEFRGAARE